MSITKLILNITILSVLSHCNYGLGQEKCPFVVAKDVQLHLLKGSWYGVRMSTGNRLSPDAANCSYQQFHFYSDRDKGTHILWNETTCNTQSCNSIGVDLYKHNKFSTRGELYVDFYSLGREMGGPNWYILLLDEHFMMYYFCVNGLGRPRAENAMILSRLQFPSRRHLRSVEYHLQSYGLDLTLDDVNQDGCPNLLPTIPNTGRRSLLSSRRRDYYMNKFYKCIYWAKTSWEKMFCNRILRGDN